MISPLKFLLSHLHGILNPILVDSWGVLFCASTWVIFHPRARAPGPTFTGAWLLLGILSFLSGSDDAKTLFYLIGFGLVTSWYGMQLVQKDLWERVLVYWKKLFPSWCVSTMVRCGDVLIHILPFYLALRFHSMVRPRHLVQAILYERIYFLAIEGSLIGHGSVANKIYRLTPPCDLEDFKKMQILSTMGYCFASSVCAPTHLQRRLVQIIWAVGFLFVELKVGTSPRAPQIDIKIGDFNDVVLLWFRSTENKGMASLKESLAAFGERLTRLDELMTSLEVIRKEIAPKLHTQEDVAKPPKLSEVTMVT